MRRSLLIGAALAAFAATLLAAPAAQAGGGGCHAPATEGRGAAVEMVQACFAPSILHVEQGTTVTFTNRDPFSHPTHGRSGDGPGASFGFDGVSGEEATVRFDQRGVFPYACLVHPGMVGLVIVGDGDGEAVPVAADTGTATADAGAAPTEVVAAEAAAGAAAAEPPVTSGIAPAHQLGAAAAAGAVLALLGSFLARRRRRSAPAD